MQSVPLIATPSQTVQIVLGGQSCSIDVYQKSTGLFCDLYVNDALIIGGVVTQNVNRIVRSLYLGFIGDLIFLDTQGKNDPDYTGLGARYILLYLSPDEVASFDAENTAGLDVSVPAFVPLPQPPILSAAGGYRQNTLTWDTQFGFTYDLYWLTTPGVAQATGNKVAGVTSGYVHTGRTDNTDYYYVLVCTNADGETAVSNKVSGLTLPAAPTGLNATGGLESIVLGWSPIAGLTYNLYWSLITGVTPANGTKISGVANPYTHGSLADLTEYFYIITAVNATGESVPSAEVNATTLNPLDFFRFSTVLTGPDIVLSNGGRTAINNHPTNSEIVVVLNQYGQPAASAFINVDMTGAAFGVGSLQAPSWAYYASAGNTPGTGNFGPGSDGSVWLFGAQLYDYYDYTNRLRTPPPYPSAIALSYGITAPSVNDKLTVQCSSAGVSGSINAGFQGTSPYLSFTTPQAIFVKLPPGGQLSLAG